MQKLKVHLTPKSFFAKKIRLISWSNLAQKVFDLVKSSNFYAPPNLVKPEVEMVHDCALGIWGELKL